MDLRQEIERVKRTWNGITYWSAMDLFRFLELGDWNDFQKKIKDIDYRSMVSTVPHVVNYTVKGVTDYLLTPEAAFTLLNKINSDRNRYIFAVNYFVQIIIDKQKQQRQVDAIDTTKKNLVEADPKVDKVKMVFKNLVSKNKILVKKSTNLSMLSDWFVPALILVQDKITGKDFMCDIDMILSTYLDMIKTRREEFGFSDEAVKKLCYEINMAFSMFQGYFREELEKMNR